MYTLDGQVILFIKVHPINVDLLSIDELESKMENSSIEFSNEQDPYSILVIPRMVDISENIYFQEKLKNALEDDVCVGIVNDRIVFQNELIKDKDIIESEFYLCIWDKSFDEIETKLEKRANNWVARFRNCEFKSEILEETGIILLIKSFTIPEFARKEGTDYRDNIVRIKREE